MERPTDELVQRLLAAAVAAGAGGDAPRLVDEARAEAEAEIKELVKSAMKAVLLRHVVARLEQLADPHAAPTGETDDASVDARHDTGAPVTAPPHPAAPEP